LNAAVWNAGRAWQDEIIYFLLVDRFHDGKNRSPGVYQPIPSAQEHVYEEILSQRQGGTFAGIRQHLAYIRNLGCTTIWLSPVFENYPESYHGYAIRNFLKPDPAFGTLDELKELVQEAHRMDMRIVLDIVINHTANTWTYQQKEPFYKGTPYAFGNWRDEQYPLPAELRNPDYYKKAGAIRHWDSYPETQEGDIFELKKLTTDLSPIGREVLEAMIQIYSYWIRELDIDGFRLDTVKHLAPASVAYFCEHIRQYARYLGKTSFRIFGEAVGGDELIGRYLKPARVDHRWLPGLDAALDFPLHFILEEIVQTKRPASELYKLVAQKEKMLLRTNRSWSDWFVFADNHDQIGQQFKARIGAQASEQEVLALVGLLYFLYGVPCLYYGTEQKMGGSGFHDRWLREPMFDQDGHTAFHNSESFLYKEIAKLAALRQQLSLYREARPETDDWIAINNGDFVPCTEVAEIIYWAKGVYAARLIVLYNPSKHQARSVCVKLSEKTLYNQANFEYVYGAEGEVRGEKNGEDIYLQIELNPLQFVILQK
jgi:glycosidase